MAALIEPIAKLVNEFTKLPGVGVKTAQRFAYKVVAMSEEEARGFADALIRAKTDVHYCKKCGNYSVEDICPICKARPDDIICVVKEPKDVLAMEKASEFKGVYHVLGGTINPMEGVGPDDIAIKPLLARLADGNTREVILATNPDVEGEATAMYIAKLIKPLGIRVTRIAHGIAVGTDLEYADVGSLARAVIDRREI